MSPARFLLLRTPLLGMVAACWAPDVADPPTEQPSPPPPAVSPAPARPTPSAAPAARPTSPPAPRSPPPTLTPTPESGLGSAPYTAWTTHAPLTPVGPGGVPVAHIRRLGVRIEVAQVLGHRTRFRCTGCSGEAQGVEAWLQPSRLRAAGSAGTPDDPLVAALQLRARWASGSGLPPDAEPGQMCALIDAGFEWTAADTATWSHDGGRLVLQWTDGRWSAREASPAATSGDCRARRPG